MRTLSAPLIALLAASSQFYICNLFTLTLRDGTVLRYTDAGKNITFNSVTWVNTGPLVSRGRISYSVGITVDELEMKIMSDSSLLINSVPFIQACVNGVLDGCAVVVQKMFLSDWDTPVGTVDMFTGKVSNVEASRQVVEFRVKSFLERLDLNMPRNVYQASCTHTLYSAGCGVNRLSFTVSGTVTAQNPDGSINTSLSQADGYFNMGAITFTSGPNAGVSRAVKLHQNASGKIFFPYPLPEDAVIGNTFTILPGCDKRRTGDCTTKYSNVIHFKGFEFIPVPETIS